MSKNKSILPLSLTIIITLYSLFLPLFQVKAEGAYTGITTTGGVRLRSLPTTDNNADSSSNIVDTLSEATTLTVISTTLYKGSGCDEGWLNVSYNNVTGYVCSKYITESKTDAYDKPWNTPKKAIIGGAKWIASGYINVGQFTSYLKKFNVNPTGKYPVYNHEYQTNVMAPFSEAVTTQRAYWKANMQDLSFTFNIPVYEEMAASYDCASCKHVSSETNTDKIDPDFETEMTNQGFPESYKPALRSLHYEHPTWKFVAMKTNLKYADVITNETGNNYIYKPSDVSLCLNGKCTETNEKNWYYASSEAIAYFMDPRNFLNETYIFQFNSLEYNDYYTESLLNVSLANTFMEGMDFIDNQTYASIFIEAGKEAGVNPLYLAALSLQENSSNGSVATTGDAFTYNDISYSGLFNFYNIGAYGGTNPVREGLVYASGNYCTICADYSSSSSDTTKPTVPSASSVATNLGLTISSGYIKGFKIGELANNLTSKSSYLKISTGDTIGTGAILTFTDGTSTTAVVYGDLTGDGKVNSADLLKMRQYLLGQTNLTGAYGEAANIAGNGTINSANLLKLRQYLLGNTNISQS